jgi:hypothetical protein
MILHDLTTLPPALKAMLQGRLKKITVKNLRKRWKLKSPWATGFLSEKGMSLRVIRFGH